MRSTQRKGDYAVTRAIASFTKSGYDVSLPITESASYDIIVDYKGSLKKVQVRYFSGKLVELRRIHSNSKGYVIKKTKTKAYDWLYALNDKDEEFLYFKCFEGRRSVTPQTKDAYSL